MEEKMISIDTSTPQSTRDMWMLDNNKENQAILNPAQLMKT